MRKPPSPRVDFQDEDARLNREYRQLRDDHSKIADRMAEFERRQRRPERFTNSVCFYCTCLFKFFHGYHVHQCKLLFRARYET